MDGQRTCIQTERFGKMESDIKTIFKHIDEQLTITKAVYELAAEVRVMNERMENMTRAQQEMREDLDELKAVELHHPDRYHRPGGRLVFQIGLNP